MDVRDLSTIRANFQIVSNLRGVHLLQQVIIDFITSENYYVLQVLILLLWKQGENYTFDISL